MPELDLLTIGRVNFDLYAQRTGVEFTEVGGWDAMVGGSPANAALAAARLGVRAGVLTAVGDDLVGDWVLEALRRGGVDTELVARKRGPHTSLALRAQLPPDHPLAFYRHDPADVHVSVEDAEAALVESLPVLLVSADALARGSMAVACRSLLRRRRRTAASTTYLDLDLREINWPDRRTYANTVAATLDEVDVILGTEEEFAALLGIDAMADPAEVAGAVGALLAERPGLVALLKRGGRGASLFQAATPLELAPFAVEEVSTVGAGDSFAGGLIAARLRGLGWEQAATFASACAAITVSRPGCSDGFPRLEEVEGFLATATAGSRS